MMKKNSFFLDENYLHAVEEQFNLEIKDNRTILDDMEILMIGIKEKGLTDGFFEKYGKYTKQICKTYGLKISEAVLFSIFIEESDRRQIVADDEVNRSIYDFKDYISTEMQNEIRINLRKGTDPLIIKGLLTNVEDNRLHQLDEYQLTEKSKDEFNLSPLLMIGKKRDNQLMSCKNIQVKELYYNTNEKRQIDILSQLLHESSFKKVQKRLQSKNFRIGFACIFYGSPGSGKTETVYQLARKLKRDLLVVNIAEMKSKWFGESEKIIQRIFSDYNKIVSEEANAPILLFNEADAIFSRRKTNFVNSSIDQTENTIQNIILNEMENLKGILIATTNLTQNLDAAFERRFLFKIKFEKPTLEAKVAIWNSMLTGIISKKASYSIAEIAQKYDFSGGQIENVARKCQIDIILNNSDLTLEKIHSFCEEENFNTEQYTRIGYLR